MGYGYLPIGVLLAMSSAAISLPFHKSVYSNRIDKRSGVSPSLTVENVSRVKCAVACSVTSWCEGADYQHDSITPQCHLLQTAAVTLVPDPGWTYICCDCPRYIEPVCKYQFTN